jgi:hypothetical protein
MQSFICESHLDKEAAAFAGMFGVLAAMVIILGLAEQDSTPRADLYFRVGLGIAMGFVAVSLLGKAEAPFRATLDDHGFTVSRDYRRPRELRVTWERIDHIAVRTDRSGRRRIVAVLPPGGGFIAGVGQRHYSKAEGGYVMCDLRAVAPSEEAFREALRRYSGSDIRG